MYYTTDGTDPTVDGDTAKIASDGKITVDAPNKASAVTLKAIAVKNGKASEVTEKTLQFIAVPDTGTGTKVYLGTAVCPGKVGKPYDVKVKVTVIDGVIRKVEDNGTNPSDIRDSVYWGYVFPSSSYAENISAKLSGKDFEGLLSAQMVTGDKEHKADAVSGATISSDAVRYACVAAMQTEPVECSEDHVLLPVVTLSKGYEPVASNNDWRSLPVVVSASANATVYYTTDGTEPTAASTRYTSSVSVKYDSTKYPDGQKIPFQAVAIDDKGQSSRVVTLWLVFAKGQAGLYQAGTYTGTGDGITATVVTKKDYGTYPIVQSIKLDDASAKKYADFLPELLAEVYVAQSTQITLLEGVDEADQQAVLNAIEAALQQARA